MRRVSMSIDILIVLLSLCFGVIVLATVFVRYRVKLGKTDAKAQTKGSREIITEASSLVDYDIYKMEAKEKLICILTASIVIFIGGYIFYRSALLSLLLTPLALFYPRIRTKEIIRKRKIELNLQFREALYSVASSLSAGKSIEAALKDAHKELSIQYSEAETYILTELRQINTRLEMNETIEEALSEFAVRSHLEDIVNFTDVFAICKRTGGNLVQVVKNTAEIISEKIDVKQEINVLLTEKRLEYKVLNLMPVFIVSMLSTSAEEFMSPVFTEPLGRAAMTFSLMLFSAAYFISRQIMDIEV
jgi:tight adherence protein B